MPVTRKIGTLVILYLTVMVVMVMMAVITKVMLTK